MNKSFNPYVFFEKAFGHTYIPDDLRTATIQICQTFNIQGLSDPMYIANVTAKELGIGDGQGLFTNQKPKLEHIQTVVERLTSAYKRDATSISLYDILQNTFTKNTPLSNSGFKSGT